MHGPVPLVIGVTGHRDLVPDEVARLEEVVERFFLGLRDRFPDLPLRVLTPLAEGADQVVAGVARRLDLELNILVPMPLAAYQQDFSGASAAAFAEMLSFGEIIELPWLPDTGLPPASARDAQYEYLGVYLTAHSHVLLALWDGQPSEGPGGTAQVIRFHHDSSVHLLSGGEPRSVLDFSEDESDLTFHVACNRLDRPRTVTAGDTCWLTRDDVRPRTQTLPTRYTVVFERQAQLNRDLARDLAGEAPPGSTAASDPFPPSGRDARASVGRTLFVAVDALAVRFQRRAVHSLRAMYALAALAGMNFIVYADFPDQDPMIWLYLLFVAAGFALYLLERRGAWYRRYVDYRCLAEGLRVQSYWALAGVRMTHATEFPHDRFMKRAELELGWIRNVMRYAGLRDDAQTAAPGDAAVNSVVHRWVEDEQTSQSHYYRSRVERASRRSRITDIFGALALSLGILTGLALATLQDRLDNLTVSLMIASMAGLPFLAAVRSSYADRIAGRQLIDQYAHMNRIFANAERLLAANRDVHTRREILRALGDQALQEVGLWLLRQRERPLSGGELFHPG